MSGFWNSSAAAALMTSSLSLDNSHQDYFLNQFPDILNQYVELVKAIKFLHQHGEKHGDIRRDHILWDRENRTQPLDRFRLQLHAWRIHVRFRSAGAWQYPYFSCRAR